MTRMNYKKFTTIILCVMAAYLLSVGLINVAVDPFYIFKTPFFKVQYHINDRYAKIEFLEKSKGRFDSYIMGSSRLLFTSPATIEKYLPTAKFYNLATVLATIYEHLLHVKFLIKNGYPVKNLYIGLDYDISRAVTVYDDENFVLKLHPDVSNESRILFYWSYLSVIPKADIRRKLRANFRKKSSQKVKFDWNSISNDVMVAKREFREGPILSENSDQEMMARKRRLKAKIARERSLEENLEALRELVALCKQHHINLFLYITPYRKVLLESFAPQNYITFLKELSNITPYWDFSGYNSVTMDPKNYVDQSHYNALVSRWIAARIFNDRTAAVPKDFGVWVTKQNIKSHLENLIENFKKNRDLTKGNQGNLASNP
jgi:hypothetical protein